MLPQMLLGSFPTIRPRCGHVPPCAQVQMMDPVTKECGMFPLCAILPTQEVDYPTGDIEQFCHRWEISKVSLCRFLDFYDRSIVEAVDFGVPQTRREMVFSTSTRMNVDYYRVSVWLIEEDLDCHGNYSNGHPHLVQELQRVARLVESGISPAEIILEKSSGG